MESKQISWERRHPCLRVSGNDRLTGVSRQGCLRSQEICPTLALRFSFFQGVGTRHEGSSEEEGRTLVCQLDGQTRGARTIGAFLGLLRPSHISVKYFSDQRIFRRDYTLPSDAYPGRAQKADSHPIEKKRLSGNCRKCPKMLWSWSVVEVVAG
jgi:hypothetical protein